MEPIDQELYDQLLGYLQAEGAVEEDEAGVVVLLEFDHRVLERPLRLHVTPEDLGRHLRAAASDASSLYPDLLPLDAAWRLFTVHLDEAVQTARAGETELVLVSGGVASTRPDGSRTPLLPEIEERIALDQYYERLVDHLANRGEMEVENDALVLHSFEDRTFAAPLRIRLTGGELRRELVAADDAEALWSSVADEIARLAAAVDPDRIELVLTSEGVVGRPRDIDPTEAGHAPSHALARFLAGALRAALPSGVGIEADGPDVVVHHGALESRNGTATVLDDDDRPFDDRLLIAARAVISHVQDVATMVSTTPWPATGSVLLLPDAEVVGGRLRAWFGEKDAPVLDLGEIEISPPTTSVDRTEDETPPSR